jgi:hypothetical protein
MKTNIIGILYGIFFVLLIISAALLLFVGTRVGVSAVILPFVLLILGIFGIVWAVALREHKKWSWNVGIVLAPIALIYSIFYLVTGGYASQPAYELYAGIVGILFNIFIIYALISEKNLFIASQTSVSEKISSPESAQKLTGKKVGNVIVKFLIMAVAIVVIFVILVIIFARFG